MKTIAVYSLKGGTGKTITTATLAHLYAAGSKRQGSVLLVDADSQGNLSQYFRRYSKDDSVLHKYLKPPTYEGKRDVTGTDYAYMDILTGGMQLYNDDRALFNAGRTDAIQEILKKIEHTSYNMCIIDCAPALNMLTINALCAADYVVIPIRIDAFSTNGLVELEEQLNGVRKVNNGLQVAGVVITHYQPTSLS